jgi:hypothetical protein
MRNRSFLLGMVVGAAAASGAIWLIGWVDRANLWCIREVIREFPARWGNAVAIVFLTNCGATAPYTTSVAIKIAGESFNFNDNDRYLFIVKDKNNRG